MLGRLVPIVVDVDVLRAHRSCRVTPDQQCSGVPVVVPGFECLVLLRTARLVASLALLRTARLAARLVVSLAGPATTAVVACATAVAKRATAVSVGQLVGWLTAVVRLQGLSVACSV